MLRLKQLRVSALHNLLQFNFSALFDCFVRSLHITHGVLVNFRDSRSAVLNMKDDIKNILKMMILFRDIFSFIVFVMHYTYRAESEELNVMKHFYRQYEYNIFVFIMILAKINILFHKDI